MEQTKNCRLTELRLRRVVNLGSYENVTVEAFFEVSQANPVTVKEAIDETYPELEKECQEMKWLHKIGKRHQAKTGNDSKINTDDNPF